MKDDLPRYTMRINQVLLGKLHSVAAYHGRSVNKELEMLVRHTWRPLRKSMVQFRQGPRAPRRIKKAVFRDRKNICGCGL